MSHLTEALRRAVGDEADLLPETPASSVAAMDAPAGAPPASTPPEAPQGLVLRPDATGRRVVEDRREHVEQDSSDRRNLDPRHLRESGESPLELFTDFNPALLERLVVPEGAPHTMVEEYRKLAAALHHAQLAHGTKIVMVTSASPGEGKTLTATNLALTLSRSYERDVLLIDADLRKPTVHSVFGVHNSAGLLDVLREPSGDTEKRVPLVQVSPRLKLLLSGGITADPMSLLTSDALRALLKDAAGAFDWVIVDTPPAAFLPDCNLLAPAVDAALLVVRAFTTPYPLVQRVVESVGHAKVIGIVLNQAEQAPVSGYYGYGYGGYYGALTTK